MLNSFYVTIFMFHKNPVTDISVGSKYSEEIEPIIK